MRVSDFSKVSDSDRTRVSARLAWEDIDRAPLELFFETDPEFAADVNPEANGFLLAGILSAFGAGEGRLRIEGAVCPRLCEGLEGVLRLVESWPGRGRRPLAIESTGGRRPALRGPDRAGLFLTNGVDSLHTLWGNRRNYPRDHPAALHDAIYVEGLSFSGKTPAARNLDVTRRQRRALAPVASESRLTIIPLRTNLRELEPDDAFFVEVSMSSLLAAAGHVLSRRLTAVSVAASQDLGSLVPWSSHPLLEPGYCSSAMELRQEDWTLDRLTKIRRIAPWTTAVDNLTVCFEGPLAGGLSNCGECEKCVRTRLGLLIAGISRPTAFPDGEITAATLGKTDPGYHLAFLPNFWAPLVGPLKEIGRRDLSRAVERFIAAARRRQRWNQERDWKGRLRRFDRKHMGGALLRAARRIRGFPASAGPA